MTPNIAVARHGAAEKAVVILVLALAAFAWWPGLAALAEQQIDAGLKRALVSFGAARGLNAVLSALQGSSVSAQPLGIGVTFSLGQVLEPVNRIVEQLSTVMLYASVAFGIERVLVAIGSWWPVSAALSAVAVAWSWAVWTGRHPHRWLSNVLIVLVLARFAVPMAVVGSEYLFRLFMNDRFVVSMQALEDVRSQVQKDPPVIPQHDTKNWLERLKEVAIAPVSEVRQRYESIRAAAEQAVEKMVHLIVIFVMQTAVLPLIVLWALVRSTRVVLIPKRLPDR